METFSIIVPIYKGNNYISGLITMAEENWETFNAVQQASLELVLVNDFPAEKLKYDSSLGRNLIIKEVLHEKNQGIHASRIHGFLHSEGEYVVFLDQDDVISSVYLKEQYRKIKDGDAVVCNGKNQSRPIYRSSAEHNRALKIDGYKKGFNRIVSPGQVLLKRHSLPALWLKHPFKHNGADDYYLWFLMLLNDCKLKVNGKTLYLHTITENNTSNNQDEMQASKNEMIQHLEENQLLSHDEILNLQSMITPGQGQEDIRKKYHKSVNYTNLLDCWLSLAEEGKGVDEYFYRNNLRRIAVYGMGILGRHLKRELENTDIDIVYVIDKNSQEIYENIEVISPGEPMKEVDAIIVTPVYDYPEIRNKLQKKCNYKIISLETVIKNIDISIS